MSAPTKAETLEEFASNLKMTRKELLEFCLTEIFAEIQSEQDTSGIDYLNETLFNPEWLVHQFQHQAWDLPSFINWCCQMQIIASEEHRNWDT